MWWEMPRYKITLFRGNGRVVKEKVRTSKYAAKLTRDAWEEKYDDSYYVTIEPVEEENKKSFLPPRPPDHKVHVSDGEWKGKMT